MTQVRVEVQVDLGERTGLERGLGTERQVEGPDSVNEQGPGRDISTIKGGAGTTSDYPSISTPALLLLAPPPQVAHHRHGLPDPLAPAALGAPAPRVRAPARAPRRTAAERLPPAPAPLPGPTAHARSSGGGADRERLTSGDGPRLRLRTAQLVRATHPKPRRKRAWPPQEGGGAGSRGWIL